MNTGLQILSFNVNGFHTPERQKRYLDYFSTLSPPPSAILLQEHKIGPSQRGSLHRAYAGKIFFSRYCATLIPNTSPLFTFPLRSTVLHERLLLVECDAPDDPIHMYNMYAPVKANARRDFFLHLRFPPLNPTTLTLLAGDLNDCPDLVVDRTSSSPGPTHWPLLMTALTRPMIDTVRTAYPLKPAYTRPHTRDGRVISWSRIDYILLLRSAQTRLLDAGTLYNAPLSDHRPVFATLALKEHAGQHKASLPTTSINFCRLHPLACTSDEARVAIGDAISSVLISNLDAADAWEEQKSLLARKLKDIARQEHHRRNAERRALVQEVEWLESLGQASAFVQERWTVATTRLRQLSIHAARSLHIRAHLPTIESDERITSAAHSRLAGRTKSMAITAIRTSPDTDPSTDIHEVLEYTARHFQAHYTRTPVTDEQRQKAQDTLLKHIERPSRKVNSRFISKRIPQELAQGLDAPITKEEVVAAINQTDYGRSPGPSGLPYEMYRSEKKVFALMLAKVFNDIWQRGHLSSSMAEGTVRLLFKTNKQNADPTNLAHYRPITLRETDYKLLSKVLVTRLNSVLPSLLPPSQHGFVPDRQSADAGRHLAFLIEEIRSRDMPEAAVLSLDQESAYDLVDHGWLDRCYAAYGIPDRFRALLRVLYDGTRLNARYNINGFLTSPVQLRVGLGQGDPLSCASWNISFQPFLDALVIRKVAMRMYANPAITNRHAILTHLAFADDAVVIVESANVLPLLETLAQAWKCATNGRMHPNKTEALALGTRWKANALAASIKTVSDEEPFIWIGLPFSPSGHTNIVYRRKLDALHRGIAAADRRDMPPSSRARYANLYLLSRFLNLLTFQMPPADFVADADRAIADFTRGSGWRYVSQEVLAAPIKDGGLGLVRCADVVTVTSLKVWDVLAYGSLPIWHILARRSLMRARPPNVPIHKDGFLWWALITRQADFMCTDESWNRVFYAVRRIQPAIHLDRISMPEVLALPPALTSLHEILGPPLDLRKYAMIAQLYQRNSFGVSGHWPPERKPTLVLHQRWQHVYHMSPALHAVLPRPVSVFDRNQLPLPLHPQPSSFSFFGECRPYKTSKLRWFVVCQREDKVRERVKWPQQMYGRQPDDFWEWLKSEGVPASERDVHWRLMYGVTPTLKYMKLFGHVESTVCNICEAGAEEDETHYFFECRSSSEVWKQLSAHMSSLLECDITPTLELQHRALILGLPVLRPKLDTKQKRILRHTLSLGFYCIHTSRQRAHKGVPLHPTRLVKVILQRLSFRVDNPLPHSPAPLLP